MSKPEETEVDLSEITTPPCRLAFPSLFKQTAFKGRGSDQKAGRATYNCVILIPPDQSETVQAIKAAMSTVAHEKWGAKLPKLSSRANPLHECEGQYVGFDPEWHYVRAQSGSMPAVVDQALRPIFPTLPASAGPEEIDRAIDMATKRIYGGCWCRFHISAYIWDNDFGVGFGFNLNAVQLIREDTAFDGRRIKVDDVFDVVDGFEGVDAPGPVTKATKAARNVNDLFG